MGRLVDGKWSDEWYDTKSTGGRFERKESSFRDSVRADGSTPFAPEAGRYHLYVSLACPWAHRTLIGRKLKRLDGAISVSVVHPLMGEHGWVLGNSDDTKGVTGDTLLGKQVLHEVYSAADPHYTGRVTVPVLWDRERATIVNNESSEILRMLNAEFNAIADATVDLYPEALREEIDEINAFVYPNVNNGVYRCGFATTQAAYEEAFAQLFSALDELDARLGEHRYLAGDCITEADWRLFTTLVRFDAVYVGHFKCNLRRIADYPNLSGYLRELFQVPGVAATVNFEHIKRHYYESHETINPTGVVPIGPELDLEYPHGRGGATQEAYMSEPGYRLIDPPTPNEKVVAYELHGHFSADDMRELLTHLESEMEKRGKLRLYQDVSGYEGVELKAIGEKFKHMGKLWSGIEKVAVVGDQRWMEIWIGIVDPITPQQLKYFPVEEKDAAFAWLNE